MEEPICICESNDLDSPLYADVKKALPPVLKELVGDPLGRLWCWIY